MNLILAKEEIKHQIDLVDDKTVLKAIMEILSQSHDEDIRPTIVNEPLIDEEMGIPDGKRPTKQQFEEWLDKDDGPGMTGEEAMVYIKKRSEELMNGK